MSQSTYTIAIDHADWLINFIVSTPKVENVVKDPTNPVPIPVTTSEGKIFRREI